MSKQKMTLEEVKAILTEEEAFLQKFRLFKGHAIAKAIKKDLIELDAVAFLYSRIDEWDIRNYIWETLNFSVKDAASSGLMKHACHTHGELDSLFVRANGIGFKTGLEFAEFVKEKFNVDLTVRPSGQYNSDIDNTEFKAFTAAFVEYYGACHLLRRDNKNAAENRVFYKDAFLYLIRLSQYRIAQVTRAAGRRDNFSCNLEDCLVEALLNKIDYMGVIDYPVLKDLLEKEVKEESTRTDILMTAVNAGYYTIGSTRNPFDSFEDFLKIVKDLKAQDLNKFPFVAERGFVSRDFISKLFNLGINMNNRGCSKERKIRLTEEQKADLFTEIYEPILYNKYAMHYISRDSEYSLQFVQAILNTAPLVEKDNIYRYIKELGLPLNKAITRLCSLSSLNFYPTELMAKQLLDYKMIDWSSMAIPKEKLYDLEYIDNIVKHIGRTGILFGTGYDRNEFAIRTINPSKLPKEFYDKYGSDIDWDAICYCKNLEIPFVKEHKERMAFRSVDRKVAELIDDELAEWLLNCLVTHCRSEFDKDTLRRQRRNVAKMAGSLSAGFIARNLDNLGVVGGDFGKIRELKVKTPNITLKVLLEELS